MSIQITASMLYNFVQCPHRLNLDVHEDPGKRNPESKFVQLLWEKGIDFEKQIIQRLTIPFIDLSAYKDDEKERKTQEAIAQRTKLIYSGRIRAHNLLGEPDILRFDDGMGYIAGDIKSGSGEEGEEDNEDQKPKKHYAVQLALYVDILEALGLSRHRFPFIWDIHGKEVLYDLNAPQGPRTPQSLWGFYQEQLTKASGIINQTRPTLPALGASCKLCHWRTLCASHAEKLDDLTLIAGLGRARRDTMSPHIRTVADLAKADLTKISIKGISPSMLNRFQTRARLLVDPKGQAYCTMAPNLPDSETELFFDIEADPMRDICYLHGFVERQKRDGSSEVYSSFLAEAPTPEEEEKAFAGAWKYVQSHQPCAMFFYSKYERTWWKKLQKRYPSVATEAEIVAMFESATDLYFDVVQKCTEWPTHDHSIKTLAGHLGFKWRDTSPSGAESIEWYHRWTESGDLNIRQRILDYNHDDCVATKALLDGIRKLEIHN